MSMIFLSYSRKDIEAMRRVKRALTQAGHTVWTDENLTPGTQHWARAIDENLEICDAVVVLLSPASYQSEWVDSECGKARRYGKGIFPLHIEGDPEDAVPLSLWSIQRIDVRKNFKEGMEALLEALTKQVAVRDPEPSEPSELPELPELPEAPPPEDPDSNGKPPRSKIWLLVVILPVVLLAVWGICKIIGGNELSDPVVVKTTPKVTPVDIDITPITLVTPTYTKAPTLQDVDTPTVSPVKTSISAPSPGVGSTLIAERDGMELVFVPEGLFTMGSNTGEDDEQPAHTVFLDAFWIDKYEVTNAQYAECAATGRCEVPEGTDYFYDASFADHPVVYVNHQQAMDYCKWAGRRLPSEAEWEKAARSTDGRLYPWGDEFDSAFVNADDEIAEDEFKIDCSQNGCDGYMKTSPVGQFLKGVSPYGALDMAGNVWEWTADWYVASYYAGSPEKNPAGPSSGGQRVIRGGSWYAGEELLRVTNRGFGFPAVVGFDLGFRCAINAVDVE